MTVGIIATAEKRDTALDESIAALEEIFGASFEVWRHDACSVWGPDPSLAIADTSHGLCADQVSALLEQVHDSGQPSTAKSCPGRYLLGIPLNGSHRSAGRCAVASFDLDSPDHLYQLAKMWQRERQQQTALAKMHEENVQFLNQVSEDFEELTFLRSMAEQLALGNNHDDVSELIAYMLPLLGEAASVESLYFFGHKSDEKARADQEWFADDAYVDNFDRRLIGMLIERFGQQALDQPVVKNRVQESELALELPNVREFLLVAATTGLGPQGWLLAVNRISPHLRGVHVLEWNLSQYEFGTSEASLINTAATMLASHAHNVELLSERESLLVSVVRTLVSTVESKDHYTCGHSERVALYGKRLAAEVGYDQEACERLYMTGLLHDIGKIGVSDAILKKEGALTQEEFAEIQKHPELGWAILRELKQMDYVLPGVLHHHERLDGQGYPDQLQRDEIPRDGQVLAVVDAFDAMTSDRPYRKGMSVKRAVEIFKKGAGSQWDAQLIDAFLSILPDIIAIKNSYHRSPLPTRQPSRKSNGELIANSLTSSCQHMSCTK